MAGEIPSEIAVLRDITALLIQEHRSVRDFLKEVLKKTNDLISSDLSFVGIVEQMVDGRWVVVRDPQNDIIGAESGEWQRYFGRLKIGAEDITESERSFVGLVAHEERSRRANDVRSETFYRTSNEEIRSELAAPILFQGELLGIVNLESKTVSFFSETHQAILDLVAKLIAPALKSFMIEEGIHRPIVAVLEELGQRLASVPVGLSLEASGVLDCVATLIGSALNSGICHLFLLENGVLALRGCFVGDWAKDYNVQNETNRLGMEAVHHRSVRSRAPKDRRVWAGPHLHLVTDHADDHLPPAAFLAAPILVFGVAIGALIVGCRHHGPDKLNRTYTGADEHLLNAIQGQLGAFIEVKRSATARREQSFQWSRQVSEISKIFAEADLVTVLRRTVFTVPQLCHGQYCSIFLWKEDKRAFVLAASKGLPEELIGEASYSLGEGLTGWVGLHGRSLLLDSRAPSDLASIAPDLEWRSKHNEASADYSGMHPFAAAPIFNNGRTIGVIRLSGRDDGFFGERDEFLLTLVASKMAMAIDYSLRYEEELRLLRGLQQLTAYTRDLSRDSMNTQFRTAIVQRAAEIARTVFAADLVTVYTVHRGVLQAPPVWAGLIAKPEIMQSAVYPDDVPAVVLAANDSLYWPDAQMEPLLILDVAPRAGREIRARFVRREGIVSSAAIRLTVNDITVGVMFLNFKHQESFDADRRKLIEAFATQLALSLETATLYDEIRESASLGERIQLAHEIHDMVTPFSRAVIQGAGSILDQLSLHQIVDIGAEIRALEKHASDCVAELRCIMGELQREEMDASSIEAQLRNMITSLVPEGIVVDIRVDYGGAVVPRINRHLYLVARELFYNALRHAGAHNILIHLREAPQHIVLRVEDDGIGFETRGVFEKQGSLGLRGVQHRVNSLNGTLEIDSRRGHGSVVTVSVPILMPGRKML